jgi:cytidylate kinase
VIVTIDGPAGSGKSTVARKLANKLSFIHLNSGALFRALGVLAEGAGIPLDSDEELSLLAERTDFVFVLAEEVRGEQKIRQTSLLVNGSDISNELRSSRVGMLASRVGVHPKVREVLRHVQRRTASGNSVVVEGRDAGTVVFPDADVKFYLDADIGVRAMRRFDELSSSKGHELTLDEVRQALLEREQRDLTRKEAPLRKASDAVLVDSTRMTVDEVVELMRSVVEQRRKSAAVREQCS